MPIHLGWILEGHAVYAEFEGVISDQDWYEFDNRLVWDYLNKVSVPLTLVIDGCALVRLPSIATMTRLRAGSHHRLNYVILSGVQNKSHSLILRRIAALFRLDYKEASRFVPVHTLSPLETASSMG